MQFRARVLGLTLAAALAVPTAAQVSYVGQARRVEAIPDNNPAPTQTTGTTSQQSGDLGPFNGATNATFFWGQPGFDYGGTARVTQNSTLSPAGVSAAGTLGVTGDTVTTAGRSTLDTTFDLAATTPYVLSVAYDYASNDDSDSPGIDGLVELRRVEAGGDVTLVRRAADFVLDNSSSDTFDTTDLGTLAPGRYRLTMTFQASSNQIDKAWSYDARLAVPEPAAASVIMFAAPLVLRRRRR
jgi:hypothetical protein